MMSILIIFQILNVSIQEPIYGQHGELLTGHYEPSFSKFYNHCQTDSPPDFRPSVQFDDSTLAGCRGPFLEVLDDNTIYSILQSGISNSMLRYIRFTRSNDTGKTWLDPNIIIRYDPDIIILQPSMTLGFDGSLNVVWAEPYDNGIMFSRSTDGGNTWSDTVRVDDASPGGIRRMNPDISSRGDSLFASWIENPSGSIWNTWVAFSTDFGTNWINENQVTGVPQISTYSRPYIRYDAQIGRWYVVCGCTNGEIYVARSDDGASWQNSLVTIDNVRDANYPSMILKSDGTVYVVWSEARFGQYDTDIFISKSTDGGVSWSGSVLVNDRAGIGANQYEAHISLDKHENLHVCWIECIPFGSMTNAYYTQSTDGGNTWWEPNLTVTDLVYTITPSVPYSIAIAADTSSYAYIGWVYRFSSITHNFFSTNCPEGVFVEDNINKTPSYANLEISPNPFRDELNIKLEITDEKWMPGGLSLKIYDINGRLVRDFLLAEQHGLIPTAVTWNGCNKDGIRLPFGIYLLEFKTKYHTETRKILMVE